MVLRSRFRNACLLLAFYAASGCLVGYFFMHAHQGDRGLAAKAEYKERIRALDRELGELRLARLEIERRVSLLKADNLDRDLLDERSRLILNAAHRNDVVLIVTPPR